MGCSGLDSCEEDRGSGTGSGSSIGTTGSGVGCFRDDALPSVKRGMSWLSAGRGGEELGGAEFSRWALRTEFSLLVCIVETGGEAARDKLWLARELSLDDNTKGADLTRERPPILPRLPTPPRLPILPCPEEDNIISWNCYY